MFRSSGVFTELMCPDPRCTRPYCSFWHQTIPTAVVSQPDASTNVGICPGIAQVSGQPDPYNPYSQAVPSFSGYSASVAEPVIAPRNDVDPTCSYQGYVATSSENHQIDQVPSYVPTKIPVIPTEDALKAEVMIPPRIKEEPVDEVQLITVAEVRVKDEPIEAEEAPKVPTPPPKIHANPEKAGNLLECAQSISEIDAEIERLKRLREQHKQKAVELRGPAPPKKKEKPAEYVPKMEKKPAKIVPEYVPKMETKPVVGYGYTPTPLAVLEKKKEEKRKVDEERTRKREENQAKVKAQRSSSSELSDLFGEEPPPVKKTKIEPAPVQKRPSASLTEPLTAQQLTAAKARIARPAAATVTRTIGPSRKVASAVEQMHARMEAAREAASQSAPSVKKHLTLAQQFGETRPSIKEGRIAKPTTSVPSTSTKSDAKPALKDPTNSKVPSSVRLAWLTKMYQELRTFLPPLDAKSEAENEEKAVFDRVKHRQGYQVAVVHSMKRIRDMRDGKRAPSPPNKISHDQLLLGKHFGSVTVKAKGERQAVQVTEEKLYTALVEGYVLTEEQMVKNSYPIWVSKGIVQIEPSYYDKKRYKKTFVPDFDLQRVCVRCTKEFELNIRGTVVKDQCVFHLKNKARLPGKIRNNEAKYPCCGGDDSMEGCQLAAAHVFDTLRESELLKFQETPRPNGPEDPRSRKIYALDCEMVYTVWGPALARVTVVDLSENVVLDELVRPDHTIIDYNTTFSGITAEQLETATHTLDTVMQRFFELANTETILIGHSLESDLKAMRLVHKRVVDTSLLYPHRIDDQKKRGLRELCLDKLGKSIQDDIDGHDSKEDSIAALQLVIYKTKFDGKLK